MFLNAQNEEIQLWEGDIPGSIMNPEYKEVKVYEHGSLNQVSKVTAPTLAVFVPAKSNGTAIVICPGGGYSYLSINKEGFKVAQWLNELGITAFVLKYRLPSDAIMQDKTAGPLQDAQKAIRFVRSNSKRWNINAEKIGVLGFSAGGHLASTLSTHYNEKVYKTNDNVSARPDFSILVYPVISMENGITHKGSKNNLLGTVSSDGLVKQYSNETKIDSLSPKTFLVHAVDDKTVPVENSLNYFLKLKYHKVPAEMHLYQNGSHGFGLGKEGTSLHWPKQCENWLKLNHLID